MKKVSLIIPVYNVEDYLERCLNSAVEQTIDDYEIICVDDGSTDSSGNILAEYLKEYSQIKVIKKKNGGLSSARNAGIEAAQGKYIFFLDSDDYIDENTLEELYDKAETEELELLYFNTKAFYEDEDVKEKYPRYTSMYKRNNTYSGVCTGQTMFAKMKKNRDFLCNVGIQFFKRTLFFENELRFYPNIIFEDELFTFQAAMLAKRVAYVDKIYHHRRIRKDSIVTTPRSMKNVESHLQSHIEALSFIRDLEIEEIAVPYIKSYVYNIYRYAVNGYAQLKRNGSDTSLENENIIVQYVYEVLQKEAKKEKENRRLKQKNTELEKKEAEKEKENRRLKQKNAELENKIEKIKNSKSYRIGLAITYIPRKIKQML